MQKIVKIFCPLCLLLTACDSPEPVSASPGAPPLPDCALDVELHGSIRASVNWRAEALSCEGMPRPNGEGARLRFSGPVDDGPEKKAIAIILGLPDLEEGETARELPTNVTLMEEGTGRFFSTRDTTSCFTDIERQVHGGTGSRYRISGALYCAAPLAELNGSSNVSFTDLKFTGRLDWEPPK